MYFNIFKEYPNKEYWSLSYRSPNLDSLTFEDFKSAMVIIPFVAIIVYISVIGLYIDVPDIVILLILISVAILSVSISRVLSLEVSSKGWIFIKSNGFELAIGVEKEDDDENIVDEANDGIDIVKLIHSVVCAWVCSILNGCEEVYHEGYCEEDADKDEDHDALIAALMLDHPENHDEE